MSTSKRAGGGLFAVSKVVFFFVAWFSDTFLFTVHCIDVLTKGMKFDKKKALYTTTRHMERMARFHQEQRERKMKRNKK